MTSIVAATGGTAMAEPTAPASPDAAADSVALQDAPVRPNLRVEPRTGLTTPGALQAAAGASQARPGQVRPGKSEANDLAGKIVPGKYIVKLKDGKASPSVTRGTVQALTKANGGTVEKVFTKALHGYSAKLTGAQAKQLAADPDVAYVEPVRWFSASGTQTNPPSWGLDRIDQTTPTLDKSYTYPSTSAKDVTAYIIDSGINIGHQDFGGRASYGINAVADGRPTADDCDGHGTHVAGTVGGKTYGVAKDVKLVAVRVLNCDGQGTTDGVVAGIDWVAGNAQQPAVANMSLGGGASTAIDDAVSAAIAKNVSFTVSAGNEAWDACAFSPARTSAAITVGATDRTDLRAGFSNSGLCLDTFAPGVSITSASIGSTTAKATMSGTSMAAPHVAGAAALLLAQNPSWTPEQVRNSVVTNGVSGAVFAPGMTLAFSDGTFGGVYGIDRLLHVGAAPVTRSSVGLRAWINDGLVAADSGGSKPLIAKSWTIGSWEKFDIVSAGDGLVALKSKANGKYVAADGGGSKPLLAKSTAIGAWEKFQLVHNIDSSVSLKAQVNGKYVAADGAGSKPLIAKSTKISDWEKFDLESPNPTVSLKAAANGKFVAADGAGAKPLLAKSTSAGAWEKFELVELGFGDVALRALVNKKYVTAQSGGSKPLLAKASSIGQWEAFNIDMGTDVAISLRSWANTLFVKADSAGSKPLIAKGVYEPWNDRYLGTWEFFTIASA
ncbi:S8 family serine peptidase [Micromonospora okii]|uniref:S8 family serine peptidase n=1 Tax=Micromonospora okii TaxID=1182970 RepID=UPI001E3A8246|nr:S8 family serine peptidase [Micromonospora okii]